MTTLHKDTDVVSLTQPYNPNLDQITAEFNRKALTFGVVAGLRSMMPFALLAWSKENPENAGKSPSKLARLTGLAAIGEIIGDKLPTTPSRLASGPFIGRLATGAIAGAMLSQRFDQPMAAGAIRGAIGAGLGAVAGYSVRMLLAHTVVPDLLIATIEDSVALSLGLQAIKNPQVE